MEDHPLLTALANWPGRVSTQLAFEARGFAVHRVWQNRMIEFCGENQAGLLNRYWDEVALETMRCAGKVIPETRRFGIEPKYRSALLDELFAVRDFVEPPFQVAPLVRGLYEHLKKSLFDREFANSELAFIRVQKRREGERLGIKATGWTGKKRDVLPSSMRSAQRLHSSAIAIAGIGFSRAVSSSRSRPISAGAVIVPRCH